MEAAGGVEIVVDALLRRVTRARPWCELYLVKDVASAKVLMFGLDNPSWIFANRPSRALAAE